METRRVSYMKLEKIRIDLSSEPNGATVYLGGEEVGITPTVIIYKISPEDRKNKIIQFENIKFKWRSGAVDTKDLTVHLDIKTYERLNSNYRTVYLASKRPEVSSKLTEKDALSYEEIRKANLAKSLKLAQEQQLRNGESSSDLPTIKNKSNLNNTLKDLLKLAIYIYAIKNSSYGNQSGQLQEDIFSLFQSNSGDYETTRCKTKKDSYGNLVTDCGTTLGLETIRCKTKKDIYGQAISDCGTTLGLETTRCKTKKDIYGNLVTNCD